MLHINKNPKPSSRIQVAQASLDRLSLSIALLYVSKSHDPASPRAVERTCSLAFVSGSGLFHLAEPLERPLSCATGGGAALPQAAQ